MALKREVYEHCPQCGELTAWEVGINIHYRPCSKCPKPPGPYPPPVIFWKENVIFIKSKTTDAVKILHDRYIKNDPGRLNSLQTERENIVKGLELLKESAILIKQLWAVFRKISDIQGTDMSDEDLNLWSAITNHSACQLVLESAKAKLNNG